MMLLKCCTHYVTKSGKLSIRHRTGKGQFSFQSQRRAMSKNVQPPAQLHSFHMLARKAQNLSSLGFKEYMNQEFSDVQAGFRKGGGTRDQLPTSVGSQKKQENSRKISTSASLTRLQVLTVDHNKLWKILQETGIPSHLTSS